MGVEVFAASVGLKRCCVLLLTVELCAALLLRRMTPEPLK
jgi:hypothetical protein